VGTEGVRDGEAVLAKTRVRDSKQEEKKGCFSHKKEGALASLGKEGGEARVREG